MSLKAQINTDVEGNITIEMQGGLDYETSIPLRDELIALCREFPESKVTLNLHAVDFVGSSGIKTFVDTINTLNKTRKRIHLSNVKSEFIKIFRLYTLDEAIILMDEFDDKSTDILNLNGKRTYQN